MHDSTLTPAPPHLRPAYLLCHGRRPRAHARNDRGCMVLGFVACLLGEHVVLGTTTPTLSVSSVSSCMQTECMLIAHVHGCHDAHGRMHAADVMGELDPVRRQKRLSPLTF